MPNLERKVMTALRWRALSKVLAQTVSWGSTIVVMRLLVPADYGLMAMSMLVIGLSALVAEMGMGAAIVQTKELQPEMLGRVFGLSLILQTGLYIAVLAMSPLLEMLFSEPRLPLLLAVVALQLPISAFGVVPSAAGEREMRYKALSLIELVAHMSTAVLTVIAAWLGWGVWALIGSQLMGTFLRVALQVFHFGWIRPRFDLKGQEGLLAFGGSLTLNRVIWYFFSQADMLVGGRMLGTTALGSYSVASNLAHLPMQKLMAVSNQVVFSTLSRLQDDQAAVRKGALRAISMMAAVGTPLMWGLAAAAPNLVPLLLGEKWRASIVPLQLIAVVVPMRMVASILSSCAIAQRHLKLDLQNNITSALIMVPAFVAGAWVGGVPGLACTWALVFPVALLFNGARVCRALNISKRNVWQAVSACVAAALFMTAVMMGVDLAAASWPVAVQLATQCLIGLVAYLALMRWWRPDVLADGLKFLRPNA